MKVTYDEVKDTLYGLPISYYANRRVAVFLDRGIPTAYYNPQKDEIHFSFELIEEALKNAGEDETYTKEVAVRTVLYHELSHAVLTPNIPSQCFDWYCPHDVFNIFEDERIETILKDFYLDTNFKKNLLYINGGEIKNPTSPMEAFYLLVRFRGYQGTSYAKKVDEIIEKYKWINSNTHGWDNQDYLIKVRNLYDDFTKAFKKNSLPQMTEEEMKEIADKINQEASGVGNNNQDFEERNPFDNNENQEGAEGEGEGAEGIEGMEGAEGAESETKKSIPCVGKKSAKLGTPTGALAFREAINNFIDSKLTASLQSVIDTYNHKNNHGNGTTGYSGVFNPRNVARKDYRYFDRRISANGNNKFGSLHLNLYVDNSGSFDGMKDKANTLIRSLLDVEKKNRNFTFDVILSDNGLEDTTKDKCFVRAEGGNHLTYKMVNENMKKHIKKDAYVYNIVMHDGETGNHDRDDNPFKAWDRNNVSIIDTGDNDYYLKEMKSAKVHYVPYEDLVKSLGDEVIKILQVAFR